MSALTYANGLLAGDFADQLGGMQLPNMVSRAAFVWLQAANASTSSYAGLTMNHEGPSDHTASSAANRGAAAG